MSTCRCPTCCEEMVLHGGSLNRKDPTAPQGIYWVCENPHCLDRGIERKEPDPDILYPESSEEVR